jgi:L-threonylcarbamoyladenylate synthase
MLAAHYAPRAALVIAEDGAQEAVAAQLRASGGHVAELALPEDPRAAARSLYASLRALDAQGFDTIVVTLPPESEANAAVRDRLLRAATPALTNAEAQRILQRGAAPSRRSRTSQDR